MKAAIITGIAALFLATGTAHADTLPKEMLGKWCRRGGGHDLIYERACNRDTLDTLRVERNRYRGVAGEGYGCDFKKIRRLPNGSYFVHAECGGESGVGNEDYIFQIEDKQLKIINYYHSVLCCSDRTRAKRSAG